MSESVVVRAGGGLVVRGPDRDAQLAVVHRPAYDDWTIPKGKLDNGESAESAALREVHEETGLRCRLVRPAGTTTYRVAAGTKEVAYYWMRPWRFTGFEPNDEVDEMRWVTFEEAGRLLTYGFDRDLVASARRPATTHSMVHLVRHGAAGDRSAWDGPDHERPLTPKGRAQAEAIAASLGPIGVERVLSSPYVRCVETVAGLAEELGVPVEELDTLAEGPEPGAIATLLEEVAGHTAVLCSHGDVIPAMLERLRRTGVRFLTEYACAKGSTWSVAHDGERFTEAWYVPPDRATPR